MAASAVTLGIAHPPGYPVYSLVGRLWLAVFPFGEAAYRLNILSALSGAAAVALLGRFLAARFGLAAGWAGAAAFGLSPCAWALSQVSEMYALHALFAAAILNLWPLHGERPDPRKAEAAALLTGLGLANHQTLLFIVPAIALAFRGLSWRAWARAGGFLALGLAVHLYLPIRSIGEPELHWGEPGSLRGLWRLLTRADYGGLRLHPERASASLGEFGAGLALSAKAFYGQLGPLGLALASLGAASAFGSGPLRRTAAASLLALAVSGPAFIAWSNLDGARPDTLPILEPHLVLPAMFAAALASAGASALTGRAALAAALALAAQSAVWSGRHGPAKDHRSSYAVQDYASGLTASLPKGAVLFSPDDPTAFALSYRAHALGRRPDVLPVVAFRTRWGYEQLRKRRPDVVPEGIRTGPELVRTLLERNEGRIYVDLPQKTPEGFRSVPVGLAYRLLRSGRPLPPGYADSAAKALELAPWRRARRGEDFFEKHARSYHAAALTNLGLERLARRELDEAETLFKRSLVLGADPAPAWNNWANAAYERKLYGRAASRYRRAVAADDQPQFRYNLGRAEWSAGRVDEAKRQYELAFERGRLPAALNDLALLRLEEGQAESAARDFERLAVSGYVPAWFNWGLALERLGRVEEAAAAYRAYAERAPADRASVEQRLRALRR